MSLVDDDHVHAMMQAGRVLVEQGLIVGTAGNLSCKLDDQRVVSTPSGVPKNSLTAKMFLTLTTSGQIHPDSQHESRFRASSEVAMHLAIYDALEQAQMPRHGRAIVHAHPVHATALASLRDRLNLCVTAEGAATIGPIAVIDYVRPGTPGLGSCCARAAAQGARTLLLLHHGAVTLGATVEEALWRMSALEHVARVHGQLRRLDRLEVLPDQEVVTLRQGVGTHVAGWGGEARWFAAMPDEIHGAP